MSGSTPDLLLAWLKERYAPRRFGPLAFGLALAAHAGAAVALGSLAERTGLAASLVLAFRLWDDLADVAKDRVHHPDRVLARAAGLREVRRACVALLAGCVGLVAWRSGGERALILLALIAAYVAWYGRARDLIGHPALGAQALLLKYGAFVWVLAPAAAAPLPTALSAGGVYLALCAYELLEDPGLRRFAHQRRWLSANVAGAIACAVAALLARF